MAEDLSRIHFTGSAGSQQFIDDIPGVTWTSALTNGAIDDTQYVSVSSSLLLSAGTSGSSQSRIFGKGWEPSPHQTSGGAEAWVRWDDPTAGWVRYGVYSSAATPTLSFALNFQGQVAYEVRTSAGFTTAIPASVAVTAGTWYFLEMVWDTGASGPNDGSFILKINGSAVATVSGLDTFGNMAGAQLANIGTSGRVWYDDFRLYPGINVGAIDVDVDNADAEFDWEASSPTLSEVFPLTVFTDDIFAFRCRVINVPECPRTMRARNACRRIDVKPVVYH